MGEHTEPVTTQTEPAEPYESPAIERVLTPEDMEREVMFAGPGVTIGDVPSPG